LPLLEEEFKKIEGGNEAKDKETTFELPDVNQQQKLLEKSYFS